MTGCPRKFWGLPWAALPPSYLPPKKSFFSFPELQCLLFCIMINCLLIGVWGSEVQLNRLATPNCWHRTLNLVGAEELCVECFYILSNLISLEMFLKTFPVFQTPSPTPFLLQSKKRKSSCKTIICCIGNKNSCWNHEVQSHFIPWEYLPSFT